MQPCPSCGRTELTPAGNCQNCGLFRGSEAYGSGYGQGYPPPADQYSAAQYSAAPYSEPYSAPPHQGQQPYQGQPYRQPYQQPQGRFGYQNPNGYQASPARRPSTVPLIVLSVVAVILVIGIVGVVVVRAGNETGNGGNGNGNGTTAAGIDECVVGTWRVTSAKEKVDMDGTLTEFSATGGTVELKADGTGTADYGQGVTYTGRYLDQTVTITFTGKNTFSYKTVDGSFTFSNPKSDGTATVKVNGATTTSIPLDMDTKPAKYSCGGNTLTQTTDLATVELRK